MVRYILAALGLVALLTAQPVVCPLGGALLLVSAFWKGERTWTN